MCYNAQALRRTVRLDARTHSHRSGLALRQRLPSHGTHCRVLPGRRHLCPLPPAQGQPRAHGLRQRPARHSHHPQSGAGRRLAPGGCVPLPQGVPRVLGPPGHHLRPVHHDGHRQPSRGRPGYLPRAHGQGLHLHRHYAAALLPHLPPLPARPLREGRVPPLQQLRRPRRPVRPVRQAP